MHAQIKKLRYWKTEHGDLNGCQDAYSLDPSRGLFVVADGAGTTLFPAIWARILASQFVKNPLMSNDPFEVEWWVRLAQEEYKSRIPDMAQLLDWSIRQKAQNQSSDSTLATVRISMLDASSIQADLLVFGDSCIIIGNTQTKEVDSFVVQFAADFAQPPICIPSALKFFNRDFHTCSLKKAILRSEHVVILASDAVSKWIVSGGGGRYTGENGKWDAFQAIRDLSEETWPGFIDDCRTSKEMVDDDSTALILELKEDSVEGARDSIQLGQTTRHDDLVIQERKAAFERAWQEKNSELVAIYYGDGEDLQSLVPYVTGEEIKRARKVANALKEVLRAFRHAQNVPGLATKLQPVWRQYGRILQNEKCAENIRETLQRNGVNLSLSEPQPQLHLQKVAGSIPASGKQMAQPPIEQPLPLPDQQTLEHHFFITLSNYTNPEAGDKKENYENLLQAADALEAARTRYPHIHRFSPAEEEEITLARKYKQAIENLQMALNEGLIEGIDAAYDPSLISEKRLTSNEVERITQARLWMIARRSDNDKMILSNINELHKFFNLTQQDQDRIDLARRRGIALNPFQAVLKTGRLRQIADAYDPVLDSSKELTENDRELLSLAQEFVKAINDNDDDAIVAANEKIMQSAYRKQIAFTEEERERIQQAEMSVKTMLLASKQVVAKVKGQDITLEQVRKIYVVTKSIGHYWIRQDQLAANEAEDLVIKQEKTQRAADREAYITSRKLSSDVLEELIDDRLIRMKINEDKAQNVFLDDFDGNQKALSKLEQFQTLMVPDYPAFLKSNRLNESDVVAVFYISLFYEFFNSYFEKVVQKSLSVFNRPKSMRDWLDKQRKDVTYDSTNTEQRVSWLASQVGWRE